MVLVKKWPFFHVFFLGIIGQENVFYNILERKTPFQLIKTTGSKSRKIEIFPKVLTHGFGQKMTIFPCLFSGNIGQENVFYNILEPKKAPFQPIKKRSSKSRKIEFSKGVNPWFWSKNGHFSMSFFQAIQARKICFTIFQNKKTPFQPIKITRSKSRKIEIFPKGLTHGFGQKMAIFPCLFFREYRPGKFVLQSSRTKKRLSSL